MVWRPRPYWDGEGTATFFNSRIQQPLGHPLNAARQWVRNVAKTPRAHLTMGDFEADGEVSRISAQRELLRAYELFVRKYWVM
jgi:hypothetical protein